MALPRDATDGRDGLMDGDLPGGLEGAPALGGCSGCCGPVSRPNKPSESSSLLFP